MRALPTLLTFTLTLWCLFLSPSTATAALQCSSLLSQTPQQELIEGIELEVNSLGEIRKEREQAFHRSWGEASPRLSRLLDRLFGNDPDSDINPLLLDQIRTAITADPVSQKFSRPSQDKLIWLVHKKYARPYMAFLIVRSMDQIIDKKEDPLNFESLRSIDRIVHSYILERALLISRREVLVHSDEQNLKDIRAYLSGEMNYRLESINYDSPNLTLALSNFLSGIIRDVENEIASPPEF